MNCNQCESTMELVNYRRAHFNVPARKQEKTRMEYHCTGRKCKNRVIKKKHPHIKE